MNDCKQGGKPMMSRLELMNLKSTATKLVTIMLVLGCLDAYAQRRGGHHQPYPQPGPVGHDIQVKKEVVNKYLYAQETLGVLKTLRIGRDIKQGAILKRVVVKAQATSHRAKLVLLINNQRFDAQPLNSYDLQKVVFQIPTQMPIRSVKLKARGDIFIKMVKARIQTQAHGPSSLRVMPTQINPRQPISLASVIGQRIGLRGLKVSSIQLDVTQGFGRGSHNHPRGGAVIQVMVHGQVVGAISTRGMRHGSTVFLNYPVPVHQITLRALRGGAYIQSGLIQVTRSGPIRY
jgi:hypothetical protein